MNLPKEINDERLEHNNNITEIPVQLKTKVLHGDRVIVKRLAYVNDETPIEERKSTIEEPKSVVGATEAGNIKFKFSDEVYAPVGVVMLVGDGKDAQKYQVGDWVELDYKALARNHYDYLLDRTKPVTKPEGYVLLPSQMIETREERLDVQEMLDGYTVDTVKEVSARELNDLYKAEKAILNDKYVINDIAIAENNSQIVKHYKITFHNKANDKVDFSLDYSLKPGTRLLEHDALSLGCEWVKSVLDRRYWWAEAIEFIEIDEIPKQTPKDEL